MATRLFKIGVATALTTDTPADLKMFVGGTIYAAVATFQTWLVPGAGGGVAYGGVPASVTLYLMSVTMNITTGGVLTEIGYGDAAVNASGARPANPVSITLRSTATPSVQGWQTIPLFMTVPTGKFPYYELTTADVSLIFNCAIF